VPDAAVETGRVHPDEHLVVADLWLVDVSELEHVG
jgi:hypothetical protein